MRMPEPRLVFRKPCFDTDVAPQRNMGVPLRKHSFAHKDAALRSVLPPHAAKCDLPMAIKKIHYHSLRIQQQEGLAIFLGRIQKKPLEIPSFPGVEKQFKRTIMLLHVAK